MSEHKQDRREACVHPSQRAHVVKGVCPLCYGMPWRVEGEECSGCGMRRGVEDVG